MQHYCKLVHKLKKHIALFQLALFFAVLIVPKELVHELMHHKDTVCSDTGKTEIEGKHRHCQFLYAEFSACIHQTPDIFFPEGCFLFIVQPETYQHTNPLALNHPSLRAPPISNVSA